MIVGAIIPAFNAADKISAVIHNVKSYLGQNIIVIDDGSVDNTKEVAAKTNVVVLCHDKNLGKGAALKTGFQKALSLKWDAIITLDADGQHNPAYIPELIRAFSKKKYDIIIGSRMGNLKKMPFHRIFSNKTTSKLLSWRLGQQLQDSQSGYRIIRSIVLRNINLYTSHYDTETEVILKSGLLDYKIGFIDIETIYQNEPSSIRLITDTWRFIKLYFSSFFW